MRVPARNREAEGMTAVIEVQHLHKTYGDTVAVGDVSFTVHEGEIFGILGPNGAGKTCCGRSGPRRTARRCSRRR
jgi:ABC-type transporter Mla maintaining outer membrane lipid asymmetry ATPase subunit MlaF